jgi:hypothetical protein
MNRKSDLKLFPGHFFLALKDNKKKLFESVSAMELIDGQN